VPSCTFAPLRSSIFWCLFETASVPVHVDTNPPMTEKDELVVIAKINEANGIVDQLKKTSPEVMRVICALQENVNDYQRFLYQNELTVHFQAALYQRGFSPGMVSQFSQMLAYNTVEDIKIVLVKRGDSIVIYFLCKTAKALYKFGQMIVSGFMHAVFAAVIESLVHRPTTVDVYVRADEFNLKLFQLSSPQDKGNSIDRILLRPCRRDLYVILRDAIGVTRVYANT